jgi:prevent-host-death family protein
MTLHVGIRELRQNPAAAIGAVKDGEIVVVTDRGVSVAQLVPVAAARREQLLAAGKLRAAVRDYRSLVRPVAEPESSGPGLSERLAQLRAAERD